MSLSDSLSDSAKVNRKQIIYEEECCEECGKPWNSEYHCGDVCTSGEAE